MPQKNLVSGAKPPQETAAPDGIFSIGSWVEEDLVQPWLDRLAREYDAYLAQDLYVKGTFQGDVGKIKIAGKTDPVFCDRHGVPVLVTEVKSKASLTRTGNLPSRHHKAQLHAYQYGIAQEFEIDPPMGVVIYVGKKRFDGHVESVEYDPFFFADVIRPWCEALTVARLEDILPEPEPCQGWECDLYEYRERCGEGDDTPWTYVPADHGFLLFFEYPKESVIEYLQSHPEGALTPTLAHQHPDLAESYNVAEWLCTRCTNRCEWTDVDWDGDIDEPPLCPSCMSENIPVTLTGPTPDNI